MTDDQKPVLDRYIAFVDRLLNPPKKPKPPESAIRYAEFGTRIFACTIDMLLSMLILAPFMQVFAEIVFTGHNIEAINAEMMQVRSFSELITLLSERGVLWNIVFNNMIQVVVLGVITVLFWIKIGGTPGKRLMRLRIVDQETLTSITKRQCIMRFFGYFVSTLPCFLGFLVIPWNEKRQGWHDKIAHTIVVQDKWRWPWKKNEAETNSTLPPVPASGAVESKASE